MKYQRLTFDQAEQLGLVGEDPCLVAGDQYELWETGSVTVRLNGREYIVMIQVDQVLS
jgi:uncharacterized protein (DUF779 family)